MKIKICGVTRRADARALCSLGVDAIGLNFYERSPRCLTLTQAQRIADAIDPLTLKVGVFVNASLRTITHTVREVGLQVVQLHGDEPSTFIDALEVPVIRAVRLGERRRTGRALTLLDAAQSGYGGGGVRVDWRRARQFARTRPVMLAGGLTPQNVALAIRTVRPVAVDVASGVERSPGIKDLSKVEAFICAVRSAA